jgi:transcriptional regulator with XRE-family HTH domain
MVTPEPYPARVPELLSRAVAGEVRRLLADRGISGRELSRLTGLPQKTVADKLAGRSSFDVDDLAAVAGVLDVDVTDLVSWAQRN